MQTLTGHLQSNMEAVTGAKLDTLLLALHCQVQSAS